jgi:hypothetical protein
MKKTKGSVLALACIGAALSLPLPNATATTRTFPGCGATLNDCVQNANSGDTILIAADVELTSDVPIEKSLTLKAAPGKHPTISADTDIHDLGGTFSPADPVTIKISGLKLDNVEVSIQLMAGEGHLIVQNNNIHLHNGNNGQEAVSLYTQNTGTGTVDVISNVIHGNGTGIVASGFWSNSRIVGNTIFGQDLPNVGGGISFDLRNGGSGSAVVSSNLVYNVAGCYCGGSDGIAINVSTPSTLTAMVMNNTVDNARGLNPGEGANGLFLRKDEAAALEAHVYNNSLSRSGYGLFIAEGVVANGGDNNTYQNDNEDELSSQPVEVTHVKPGFRSPADKDFRLRSTSPFRDSGSTCIGDGVIVRRDADSYFRLASKAVDIGALEYGSTIPGTAAGKNVTGSLSKDILRGTKGVDVLCGMSGADEIDGSGGRDFLFGNLGNDTISGAGGRDLLEGGSGRDRLLGGAERDRLLGKDTVQGNDTLDGGKARDRCRGDQNDHLKNCP